MKLKLKELKAPTLREYQKTALQKLSVARKEKHRAIILKAPTGSGKTVIATQILYNMFISGKSAMMLCDRIELINQTSDMLIEFGIDHGVIQATHKRENWTKKIQVASIQSLMNRQYILVDVLIIDEAHTLFKEHIKYVNWLLENNPNVMIIGLTATPFSKGLGKVFTKCVPITTTKELIELGFLCKPTVFAPSKPDLEKIKVVAGDYKLDELEKAVIQPKLIGDIVEHWIKLAFNKPTVVFATSIKHSKAIVEEFKSRGILAEHLDAYTDDVERKKLIKNFKAGIIKILSSVDILSKGFDYPGAEVAILARPTKSLSLYIQQAGRVLRISPETGKKSCLILDHAGNTERHGFVTDDTTEELDKGNKKESSIAVKKEKNTHIPVVCPSCSVVKTTVICDNCGFEHKPKNTVESAEGYLIKLEVEEVAKKSKLVKDMLIDNKFLLYGQLKQLCIDKDWRTGRAFYIFKDIVGREPNNIECLADPYEVTPQLKSYLRHLQIKKAKSNFNPKVFNK